MSADIFGFKPSYIENLKISGYPERWDWKASILFKKAGINPEEAEQYYQQNKKSLDDFASCPYCGKWLIPETLVCNNKACVLYEKKVYEIYEDRICPVDTPSVSATSITFSNLTYVDWANMAVAYAPETYPWDQDIFLAYQLMCKDVFDLIGFAKQIQAKQYQTSLKYWAAVIGKTKHALLSLSTDELVALAYWRGFQTPSLVENVYAGRNVLAAYLNPAHKNTVRLYLNGYFARAVGFFSEQIKNCLIVSFPTSDMVALLASYAGIPEYELSEAAASLLKNKIIEKEQILFERLKEKGLNVEPPCQRYEWTFDKELHENTQLQEAVETSKILEFFYRGPIDIVVDSLQNSTSPVILLPRFMGVNYTLPFEVVLKEVWEARKDHDDPHRYKALVKHLYFLYKGGFYAQPKCTHQENVLSLIDNAFEAPENVFLLAKVFDWNEQTLVSFIETRNNINRFFENALGYKPDQPDSLDAQSLSLSQITQLFDLHQKSSSTLGKLPIEDKSVSEHLSEWVKPRFIPYSHFYKLWSIYSNRVGFIKALDAIGVTDEVGYQVRSETLHHFFASVCSLVDLFREIHNDIAAKLYKETFSEPGLPIITRRAVLSSKQYGSFTLFSINELQDKKVLVKVVSYTLNQKNQEITDGPFENILKKFITSNHILYCPQCYHPKLYQNKCAACDCDDDAMPVPFNLVVANTGLIKGSISVKAEFTNISGLMETYLKKEFPATDMNIVPLPHLRIIHDGSFGKRVGSYAQRLKKLCGRQPLDLPRYKSLEGLVFTYAGIAPFGGIHEKRLYRDQNGNQWIYKPDKQMGGVRAMIESLVSEIYRWVDIYTPPVFVHQLDQYIGCIQPVLSNVKTLSPDPNDWTENQTRLVVMSQVIRWLCSDHDGNYSNYLALPDLAIPIDAGQAYRFFGSDKLSIDYHPNAVFSTPEPLTNIFWQAVKEKKATFEKEWLIEVVEKVEKIDNNLFASKLKRIAGEAVKRNNIEWVNRFRSVLASQYGCKPDEVPSNQIADRFVQEALGRKVNLRADYQEFIRQIYDKNFVME